jgi:sugar lactone lactonase YvrE
VANGTVYVADQHNSRIEEFSTAGSYTGSVAVPTPAGVAIDRSGDIWVSSPSYAAGNSVYEFSAAGKQLQQFGNTQAGYGDMGNTGGIAVGPDGRIYVAQPDYGWVTVYNTDGSFYTEFGLQSDTSKANENLLFPQSLAVTSSGQVYVADSGNNRIVAFAPVGSATSGAAALVPPTHGGTPSSGPNARLIAALSLLALLLAAVGLSRLAPGRRRKQPTEPVMCEMPDPATAESFAAVQSQITAPAGADLSRRKLLIGATALSGVAAAGALPLSLRKRLAAAMNNPPRGHEVHERAGHAGHRPLLGDSAPGMGQRQDGSVDRGQGPVHDGILHAG